MTWTGTALPFTPFIKCGLKVRRIAAKGLISKNHLDYLAVKSIIAEK
jgi:hypothetical protein